MSVLRSFFKNVVDALNTEWGWFVTIMTSVFISTQSIRLGFYVVGGAVLADLVWGIAASIKLKKFLLSLAFRETVKKIAIYAFALLGSLFIESLAAETTVAFTITAVLISVCEFWSMSASMLIVKPDMPFLKIMRGQLKGEIQAKVGKNVNLDNILKDDDTPSDTGTTAKDSSIRNKT